MVFLYYFFYPKTLCNISYENTKHQSSKIRHFLCLFFKGSRGTENIIEPAMGYLQYCLFLDGSVYDSDTDWKI